MKRYNNLFKQICSRQNVELAFYNASKGKSHYRDVIDFKNNYEESVGNIVMMLANRTFRNAPYKKFKSWEYGKEREIFKLPFYPDRVVQHAVCQVLEPIWSKQFIRDTYACIKGRGIHDGVNRIKLALEKDRTGTRYCLKFDIKKFYPSIDNIIIKSIIRQKIKCKDTLWLLDEIVDSAKGLPIGNYLSQHFSNLYLSGFDHWIKENLKINHYFRYCDDIVILSDCKTKLRYWFISIKNHLKINLKQEIKSNWQIFPVDARGIDFLGYRFFHDYTLIRKSIVTKFKRRIREINNHASPGTSGKIRSSIASYEGWMKYANSYNLKRCYLS